MNTGIGKRNIEQFNKETKNMYVYQSTIRGRGFIVKLTATSFDRPLNRMDGFTSSDTTASLDGLPLQVRLVGLGNLGDQPLGIPPLQLLVLR